MSNIESPRVPRRGFLARLSASAASLAAFAAAPTRVRAATLSTSLSWADPDAWIERMRGTDRLVFHAHERLQPAVIAARNIFTDARDSYSVAETDNSVAVATHGPAIAGMFRDDAWQTFRLGEMYGIKDAAGQPAAHNPFLSPLPNAPVDATVPALLERGVQFIVCNVALRNLARKLAENSDPDALHANLLAGLLPGVTVVPNVYVSLSHAQQRGVSYIFID